MYNNVLTFHIRIFHEKLGGPYFFFFFFFFFFLLSELSPILVSLLIK